MFAFREPKPAPKMNYWYMSPLALIPVWYLWGNWAYVSKATFQKGISILETALRGITTNVQRLTGRVDEMENKSLLKFGEIRRDLAHVETLIATLNEKTNVIEAETKCAAQGVRVLCRTMATIIEEEKVNKEQTLTELRTVYN